METGKLTLPDGSVYEGELVNGKPHGKGKKTFSSGGYYEGDFVDGKWHGKGKVAWVEGDIYEGDWLEGKKHGKGKLTLANGEVYEGDFVENKQHGKGKKTYPEGSIYEGDWLEGKKHGKGKLTLANGEVYEGDFVEDKQHGKGKKTYPDGKVEEGNWEDNEFLGTDEACKRRATEEKRKKRITAVLYLCLNAAYLFILWGTDIIRDPWEVGEFIRYLPLAIFSLAFGMINLIFLRKLNNSWLGLATIILMGMILVQSITICVWRRDVGILLIYLIGRIVINTLSVIPGFVLVCCLSIDKKAAKEKTEKELREKAEEELKEKEWQQQGKEIKEKYKKDILSGVISYDEELKKVQAVEEEFSKYRSYYIQKMSEANSLIKEFSDQTSTGDWDTSWFRRTAGKIKDFKIDYPSFNTALLSDLLEVKWDSRVNNLKSEIENLISEYQQFNSLLFSYQYRLRDISTY